MKPIIKLLCLIVTLALISCNDEAIDNTIITAEDPIFVDSNLYNSIERVATNHPQNDLYCFNFNYALAISIFDEELKLARLEIISSDEELGVLLGSLSEGYAITISYPIYYKTTDGETIEINNNEELAAKIDECVSNLEDVFIFTDDEGNEFYTGASCVRGSPNYGVSEFVVENLVIPTDLPAKFDLSEFLPPVRSQGQMGSCTSWAVSYYMKSLQENIQNNTSNILSPAYTYNQISQGICGGTGIQATLNILKEKGVCSWEEFPYSETDCTTQPDEIDDAEAAENKISDYKGLSGMNMVDEIKTLLTQQSSIMISVTISKQFGAIDSFGQAAYREHTVNYSETGCHSMLLVGYDDFYNAFKVVNSWGPDWGNAGFVWIDYKAFDNVTDESAGFRVINGAFIAIDAE